jgi:butyrate kinase
MIIAFGGSFYLRTLLTRRAIFKVIEIFYQHKALGVHNAKTLHQLGLERPDLLQKMMRSRDYKQSALQILIKRGIILESEDGRVYLVEEKLDEHLRSKNRPTDGY